MMTTEIKSAQSEMNRRVGEIKSHLMRMLDDLDVLRDREIRGNWGYAGTLGSVLNEIKQAGQAIDELVESSGGR